MIIHPAAARATAVAPFISRADCGRLLEAGVRKPSAAKPGVLSQLLLPGSLLVACGRGRSKRCKVVLAASLKTELLVDADVHSIEQIRQAVSLLESQGRPVHTSVFAAPRRVENGKWNQFMRESGMTFQPVPRSNDSLSEPNDRAIEEAMRACLGRGDIACAALLTSDKGFLDSMVELQSLGLNIVVLIPKDKYAVLRTYSTASVQILELQPANALTGPRVRAVLDSEGGGSVHLDDPYESFDNSTKLKLVKAYFEKLGFEEAPLYLVQAIAKFWFANRLGSLTVYPSQFATLSAHDLIERPADAYERSGRDLAFFLPLLGGSRRSKTDVRTYGSCLARRIFRGGGPFMLQDSPDLTARALRRLGYLDNHMNDDLTEAIFCFLNTCENKKRLRLSGFLPGSGDRSSEVCETLHAAFLSNGSSGEWKYIQKDEASMLPIVHFLQKNKVISGTAYVQSEVLQAMKLYAVQQGLPPMKTFNGLALRILRSTHNDPNRRELIEVTR